MSFTQQLKLEAERLLQDIFKHPFVKGIEEGTIAKEALIHYIKADYEYLNAFMKIYGMAIVRSENREQIEFFKEQVSFVLNSEVHPHHNFCRVAGVRYEDLQGFPLPPAADHYVKHMLCHAYAGTIGEMLAALLPCPWTYYEIGKELTRKAQPDRDHPFYEWITFYADKRVGELIERMSAMLADEAVSASSASLAKMREAFIKSTELEWSFWEMAYTQQKWKAKGVPVYE
ncbi:thiaminase II [Jeotgalibacillus sp. R-1-5s-1]|uniref:thiaminase II n=1 Tax=Jeotgalibacillus sp. R-1-5s-1 TaxID=2555897 RepID=UPI001069B896|nr:thiaminase II [Jeotgalibacillus sp. R-1-5s-1]TFE00036.1 thiaminase II [Jeotgalibacillus sp. R-1-5s-1]